MEMEFPSGAILIAYGDIWLTAWIRIWARSYRYDNLYKQETGVECFDLGGES